MKLSRREFIFSISAITLFPLPISGATKDDELVKIFSSVIGSDEYMFAPISPHHLKVQSPLIEIEAEIIKLIGVDRWPMQANRNLNVSIEHKIKAIQNAIAMDYKNSNIICLDGWYLSLIEFLMMAYLSKTT